MREYITNGTALVWLIDVEGEKNYIFRANGVDAEVFAHEKLSGEDILVGFEVFS